ncbi:MAG: Tungsten-containing aldehyde:ferredoxin oxidoreductase [Firmicutes bacterium]|nr:Tungsten-containing aldehyde:ferredoxin oxidoreductase [Bacillota bacterium]MDI6706566.1 aldehyde ferredoxin oxidoreductase family protein [Bacillota bacterium]
MYECYNRKLLRVNLKDRTVKTEVIGEELIRDYIGGIGFGVKLLYDEIDHDIDALSPQNKLIISIGPLTGTSAPLFAQTCIVTKSPLTGGILNSYSGGYLGYRIKSSGYDCIVIEEKSPEPVYVLVSPDKVEIRECRELVGMNTGEVEDHIKKRENKPDLTIMSIGKAGENLVRFASIMSETRAFGRGGAGAVLGSKNLKAIAFEGGLDVRVSDPKEFQRNVDEAYGYLKKATDNQWSLLGMFSRYGTGSGLGLINERNALATKNHQFGHFEKGPDIDSFAYIKQCPSRKIACFGCPVHCGQVHRFEEGEFKGMVTRGPEYETMYSFGSDCLIDDPNIVAKAHQICEEYGMDTLSAGCTMAFAMECYERGILTEQDTQGIELSFGNGKSMIALLEKVGNREGVGDLFADGTKRAAEKLGRGSKHFAMNVKGMEFAAWMPQRMRGIALTFATSNRGACHKRAPIGDELMGHLPMEEIKGKAQIVKDIQDRVNACFTLVSCRFAEFELPVDLFVRMLNTASGTSINAEEFIKVGERIWNLERLFNLDAGLTKEDDMLPGRCFETLPLSDGETKMEVEDLEYMLDDYYKVRGWDEEGIPTESKLMALGINR